MAILVTGGTGLIGAGIVRLLAEQSRQPVIFDVVAAPPPDGVLDDLMDKLKVETGTITDLSDILHVIKRNNIEGIIHVATFRSHIANDHPLEALRVNILGAANILEAARLTGLRRVVIFSSAAVTGESKDLTTPLKEEDSRLPLSGIYPASKLAVEQIAHNYRQLYKVDAVVVRPRHVYGPGDRRTGSSFQRPVTWLVRNAIAGTPIRLESGADSSMDLTYVKDMANGTVLAYDCKSPKYLVYNVSLGQNSSIGHLCEILKRLFPSQTIEVGPGPLPGASVGGKQEDTTYRVTQRPPLDITRAREDLGFRPKWDLDRAIPDWVQSVTAR